MAEKARKLCNNLTAEERKDLMDVAATFIASANKLPPLCRTGKCLHQWHWI